MPDPAAPDNPALRTLHAVQLLTDALDRVHSDLTRRMEMHTSDLRALRMLAIREQHDETVTPQAIAEHLAITTAAESPLAETATETLIVPAADKQDFDGTTSVQYAGSLFEQSVLVLTDALFHALWQTSGTQARELWRTHANLE